MGGYHAHAIWYCFVFMVIYLSAAGHSASIVCMDGAGTFPPISLFLPPNLCHTVLDFPAISCPHHTSHPFPFHSISMAMGQSDDILWSSYSLSIYPPFIVSTPDIKQIIFSLLLNYLEFGLAGHSLKENHLNITCHVSPYHHEKEKVVEW